MAAWVGLASGIAEGTIHVFSRSYPLVHAAHKVSTDILWVAAVVNTVALLGLGLATLPALLLLKRERLPWLAVLLAFFAGYVVISSPAVIQRLGMLSFSAGCGVGLYRWTSASPHLGARARRTAWMIPLIVAALWGGVQVFEIAAERVGSSALPAPTAASRNALVIVLDTVRADRFAALLERGKLPHMAKLAARGVTYRRAWATSSWSLPSHGTLLTGRLPQEHKIDWPGAQRDPAYPSLAEFYAGKGYATGAFSSNAAWVTPEYMGAGFLRFQVYRLEDLLRRTKIGFKVDDFIEDYGWHAAGRGKPASQLAAEFLQFVADYPDRPFFSYLCFMDVNRAFHDRRLNRRGAVQEVLMDYDQEMERVDGVIGVLIEGLAGRGQLDNTDIVVTSDHGESFGAVNPGDHNPDGHATSLYVEQQAVPLIFAFPGKAQPATVQRAVSLLQVPVTLVTAQGWKDAPFVGDPLPFADTDSLDAGCAFGDVREHESKAADSISYREWRLLRHFTNHLGLKAGEELYRIAEDPTEQKNLAADPAHAHLLETLRAQAEDFVKSGSNARCRDLGVAVAPAATPHSKGR